MEAAKGILVVLATLFVAADCLFYSVKRGEFLRQRDAPQSSCEERLGPCLLLLNAQPFIINTKLLPNLVDNIDEMCRTRQPAADCLRSWSDECQIDHQPFVNTYLTVGDYLCSGAARALLEEGRNSPCYSNQEWRIAANEFIQNCTSSVSYPLEDDDVSVCQNLQDDIQCKLQPVTQCGTAFVTLARELSPRLLAGLHPVCSA
ncbi:hypothetical protein BsWGS_23406 [Bradybaena similaris]